MSSSKKIVIHLTVDVDPDEATILTDIAAPSWTGLTQLEKLVSFAEKRNIPLTLFLRFDQFCRHYFGKYTSLYLEYERLWEHCFKTGHELAWHIHLLQYKHDQWRRLRGAKDDNSACSQVRNTWEEVQQLPFQMSSVRIGEAYATRRLLELFSSLNFKADSSSLPGRLWKDTYRTIDWNNTPNMPYYPSVKDHRRPAAPDEVSLAILEVPMTTALLNAPYDTEPLPRYFNGVYQHHYFKKMLHRLLESSFEQYDDDLSVLTMIIHPHELLRGPATHPLLEPGLPQLGENIDYLESFLAAQGYTCHYQTINKTASQW